VESGHRVFISPTTIRSTLQRSELLDEPTRAEMRRVFSDPERKRRTSGIGSRTYLLTGGIARCGNCGARYLSPWAVLRVRDSHRQLLGTAENGALSALCICERAAQLLSSRFAIVKGRKISKRGSNPAPRTGAVAREATGISLTDLARGAGVAHQRLSLIEHEREAVSGRLADTLAHILAGRLVCPSATSEHFWPRRRGDAMPRRDEEYRTGSRFVGKTGRPCTEPDEDGDFGHIDIHHVWHLDEDLDAVQVRIHAKHDGEESDTFVLLDEGDAIWIAHLLQRAVNFIGDAKGDPPDIERQAARFSPPDTSEGDETA
jgi:hypothetical protein